MEYFEYFPQELGNHEPKMLNDKPGIHPSCKIHKSHIGGWTELMAGCRMLESTFGDYSYAAGDVWIVYADVGKFCSIASHVRINPGNHPMQRVTQHHCTYRRKQFGFGDEDDHEFFDWRRDHRCTVGHDVWMGHGAIVMPGVSIGTGAVIGSGAVVTKNVAPYEIAVGVPAKPIKKRFDDKTAEKLQEIAWWDWDHETLKERFDDLLDMEKFIEKYG